MALTEREISTNRLLLIILAVLILSNMFAIYEAVKYAGIATDQQIYMDGGCFGRYQGR
jgi:hypothetical protein